MTTTGFVIAGGKSSRMGRDKAWLEINGEPMIRRVIRAIQPVTDAVAIVANKPEYRALGLPVYADSNIGFGPIEAIRTSLENCSADYALLVACDMPFVTSELLAFLLDDLAGYDAVVPRDGVGNLEPLCAVYSAAMLPIVTELIEAGQRKPSLIYDRVKAKLIPFSKIDRLPGSAFFFRNVNTPSDYVEALETSRVDSKPT